MDVRGAVQTLKEQPTRIELRRIVSKNVNVPIWQDRYRNLLEMLLNERSMGKLIVNERTNKQNVQPKPHEQGSPLALQGFPGRQNARAEQQRRFQFHWRVGESQQRKT